MDHLQQNNVHMTCTASPPPATAPPSTPLHPPTASHILPHRAEAHACTSLHRKVRVGASPRWLQKGAGSAADCHRREGQRGAVLLDPRDPSLQSERTQSFAAGPVYAREKCLPMLGAFKM